MSIGYRALSALAIVAFVGILSVAGTKASQGQGNPPSAGEVAFAQQVSDLPDKVRKIIMVGHQALEFRPLSRELYCPLFQYLTRLIPISKPRVCKHGFQSSGR